MDIEAISLTKFKNSQVFNIVLFFSSLKVQCDSATFLLNDAILGIYQILESMKSMVETNRCLYYMRYCIDFSVYLDEHLSPFKESEIYKSMKIFLRWLAYNNFCWISIIEMNYFSYNAIQSPIKYLWIPIIKRICTIF